MRLSGLMPEADGGLILNLNRVDIGMLQQASPERQDGAKQGVWNILHHFVCSALKEQMIPIRVIRSLDVVFWGLSFAAPYGSGNLSSTVPRQCGHLQNTRPVRKYRTSKSYSMGMKQDHQTQEILLGALLSGGEHAQAV